MPDRVAAGDGTRAQAALPGERPVDSPPMVVPGRTAAARVDEAHPTPPFRLLAGLQLAAGLVVLPFALLGIDPDSNHAAEAVLAVLWILLAGFTALVAPSRRSWAVDVTLIVSSALLAAASAVAVHGSVQILNGIGILLLGVFAAYCLSIRRIALFLAFSATAYLGCVGASGVILAPWIPMALVIMLVFNTLHVWVLVNRLREGSLTDPLTGALNRTGLSSKAAEIRAVAHRAGQPTTVTVIDLDHFKAINDRQGHAAGDALLVGLVYGWASALRQGDMIARIGGDEFVVLLPNCDVVEAGTVLARLKAISPCSWSAGSVLWDAQDDDVFSAVRRADALMYRAKSRD